MTARRARKSPSLGIPNDEDGIGRSHAEGTLVRLPEKLNTKSSNFQSPDQTPQTESLSRKFSWKSERPLKWIRMRPVHCNYYRRRLPLKTNISKEKGPTEHQKEKRNDEYRKRYT